MSGIKNLWQIQNLEDARNHIERQLKRLPEVKDLKQLKKEIEFEQAQIQEMQEELNRVKKDLKSEEDKISVLKVKADRASLDLYSGDIKAARELEAAEKNIAVIRESIGQVEEQALVLMDTLEEKRKVARTIMQSLEERKKRFMGLNKQYRDKKEGFAREMEEIIQRIETLKHDTPPELLELYSRLCKKHDDGKGLAELQNAICSGCHMSVSFELLKQAKGGLENLFCDNCGRLLIIE